MPVFLEPDQKFPVVLKTDLSKPIATRPTFFFPSVSMRQYFVLDPEIDACYKHNTVEAIFQATCDLMTKHCVGWKNMGAFEFGSADFREFLTHQEAMELLRSFASNQHVSMEEKKSSE